MVENWFPAGLFAAPFPEPPYTGRPRANKKAPANRGFLYREDVAQYLATTGPPKR
jgi:hypothetical protein